MWVSQILRIGGRIRIWQLIKDKDDNRLVNLEDWTKRNRVFVKFDDLEYTCGVPQFNPWAWDHFSNRSACFQDSPPHGIIGSGWYIIDSETRDQIAFFSQLVFVHLVRRGWLSIHLSLDGELTLRVVLTFRLLWSSSSLGFLRGTIVVNVRPITSRADARVFASLYLSWWVSAGLKCSNILFMMGVDEAPSVMLRVYLSQKRPRQSYL